MFFATLKTPLMPAFEFVVEMRLKNLKNTIKWG